MPNQRSGRPPRDPAPRLTQQTRSPIARAVVGMPFSRLEQLRRDASDAEIALHAALQAAAAAGEELRTVERSLHSALEVEAEATPERSSPSDVDLLRRDWTEATHRRADTKANADEAAVRATAARAALEQMQQRVDHLQRLLGRSKVTQGTIRRRIRLAEEALEALKRSFASETEAAARLSSELRELIED